MRKPLNREVQKLLSDRNVADILTRKIASNKDREFNFTVTLPNGTVFNVRRGNKKRSDNKLVPA